MKQEGLFLFAQFRARDVLKGISFLSFYKLCIHMHVDRTTCKRNGSLGTISRGLKWKNKT